jgi:hypothetical protein
MLGETGRDVLPPIDAVIAYPILGIGLLETAPILIIYSYYKYRQKYGTL